jgi:hypothetical protein
MDAFEGLTVNHWAGLIDAAAVLVVLGVWPLLDESFSFLRAVLRVGGGALIVATAGVALQRAVGLVQAAVLSDVFSRGTDGETGDDRSLVILAVAVAALVAGAVVATHGTEAYDDEPPDDDEEDEEDDVPAPARVALPMSAWSRTEVLGDAPERRAWDPEPEPLPEPRSSRGLPPRAVGVPLLALAVALTLPTAAQVGDNPFAAMPYLGDVGLLQGAGHAATGLIAGLALLGGVLALDVWERHVVAAAFAVTALGAGLGGAFLEPLANQYWVAGVTGGTVGLLLPAAFRVLRRMPAASRAALLTGVLGAAALLGASMFLGAHAVRVLFEESFSRF